MIFKIKYEGKTSKKAQKIRNFFGKDNKTLFETEDKNILFCICDNNIIQVEVLEHEFEEKEDYINYMTGISNQINSFLEFVFAGENVGIIANSKIYLKPEGVFLYYIKPRDYIEG